MSVEDYYYNIYKACIEQLYISELDKVRLLEYYDTIRVDTDMDVLIFCLENIRVAVLDSTLSCDDAEVIALMLNQLFRRLNNAKYK